MKYYGTYYNFVILIIIKINGNNHIIIVIVICQKAPHYADSHDSTKTLLVLDLCQHTRNETTDNDSLCFHIQSCHHALALDKSSINVCRTHS